MTSSAKPIHIVGGGLAGAEATWQVASAGVPVVLHEMRPVRGTDAHLTDNLAELVCSNSFRSDDWEHNAVGLLHAEMRRMGSLIMRCADANHASGNNPGREFRQWRERRRLPRHNIRQLGRTISRHGC